MMKKCEKDVPREETTLSFYKEEKKKYMERIVNTLVQANQGQTNRYQE